MRATYLAGMVGMALTGFAAQAAAAAPGDLSTATIWDQAWREARARPALVRAVTFADPAPEGLAFDPGPQKGTLERIAGRWPGQAAVHLFHGVLAGEPIDLSSRGATVCFRLRVHDWEKVDRQGYARRDGGVMAVGSGYYDGWRVVVTPDSGTLAVGLGNPADIRRSVSAPGCLRQGQWHHVAIVWTGAALKIYVDGSVSVSTGAVEMGQGVNAKVAAIAARTLGIGVEQVRVETTNTSRIPNASPTSASTGADLNGMATLYACTELTKRLQTFAARRIGHDNPADMTVRDGVVYLQGACTGYRWSQLVADAQWARTDLSCHAFYATPAIYLDREKERGRPFAYYSYGVSLVEVLLDTRRGTYTVESVEVVHDVGESLSPVIDRGQVEGAVIQGIGWATVEQIRYAPDGRVLTGVNAYKIPDIKSCPRRFDVTLLENSSNPYAVLNSKAVGEPPFVHGLGAYFALLHALRSVRTDKPAPSLPLTPEKVFMYLHDEPPRPAG